MIAQDTLAFLAELKENNNKEWFDANRKRYEAVKKDIKENVQQLITGIAGFEPAIAAIKPKDCVFRINRDIRFSKDKSPYKTNLGAYISRGGKKSPHAGYYFHLEPGNCFLAGGMYGPESSVLNAVRQEIDYNTDEFKAIINSKEFKKLFGEIHGEQLKTAPKGYSKDHPEIELLRYKSYLMVHNISDKDVLNKNFTDKAVSVFEAMKPMNEFLNRVLD